MSRIAVFACETAGPAAELELAAAGPMNAEAELDAAGVVVIDKGLALGKADEQPNAPDNQINPRRRMRPQYSG